MHLRSRTSGCPDPSRTLPGTLLLAILAVPMPANASIFQANVVEPSPPAPALAQARPTPPVRGSSAELYGGSSADRYGGSSADRGGVAGPRDRRTGAAERRRKEDQLEERRRAAEKQRQQIEEERDD